MSKISDYKKQHPEYANIPDVELAEILYEKVYKGRIDETEFYKFAFPEGPLAIWTEALLASRQFHLRTKSRLRPLQRTLY